MIRKSDYLRQADKNLLALAPYVAILFILFGYSLCYFLQIDKSLWVIVSRLVSALVIGYLCLHLVLCFRAQRDHRIYATATLFVPLVLFACGIMIIEHIPFKEDTVPATFKTVSVKSPLYDKFQSNLKRLIKRRGTSKELVKHGIKMSSAFNSLGWPDDDHKIAKADHSRVVFIGDSILQVRSTRNIAQIVETSLKLYGKKTEVINLSQDDTSPIDYRFRFYELAFDYDPDHIVIFIYGGNDTKPDFTYTPYIHPTYFISKNAIMYLAVTKEIPRSAISSLIKANNMQKSFSSKEELLSLLQNNLTSEQNNLIYLSVLAYSKPNDKILPFATLAPRTLSRLTRLYSNLFEFSNSIKADTLDTKETFLRWTDIQPEFEKVFKLPLDQRLKIIAELAAKYNGLDDSEYFFEKLQNLNQNFLSELLSESSVTYLLLPAINKFVLNKPASFPSLAKNQAEQAAQEYLMFFKDMAEEASRHNVKLSIVMLPEASTVDEEFYSFWSPLFNFRDYRQPWNSIFNEISNKLDTIAPTVNLLHYPGLLNGGYWHFDGHLNERGNAIVSEVVTNYLLTGSRK